VPSKTVLLHVTFKITDLDDKPIAGFPARIVFGSDPRWQEPVSGKRIVTNAKGEARFSADVVVQQKMRKKASGYAEVFARTQPTDYLKVAAELPFLNFRWLYTQDVYRFPDGDLMLEGYDVFTKDTKGHFTGKAELVGGNWKIADLNGLILTGATLPGYDTADFKFDRDSHDAAGKKYTLNLWFRRHPPPVRR
jgi:hypothetical protein